MAEEKPKILIATLALTSIANQPYGSHLSLVYRAGRQIPEYDFLCSTPRRMAIDKARNMIGEFAKKDESIKYIFFYDDDTDADPDVIKRLLDRNKPCISACYYVRGYPFSLMAFEKIPLSDIDKAMVAPPHTDRMFKMRIIRDFEDHETYDEETGLLGPIGGVGMGCTLIDADVFRIVPYPWFKTGEAHTEDVYFLEKCHDYIQDFSVWMDTTIDCGHMCDPIAVTKANVRILRKFFEELGCSDDD